MRSATAKEPKTAPFISLRCNREEEGPAHRDVVIKEKENPEDKSERERERDPFSFELPEMDDP